MAFTMKTISMQSQMAAPTRSSVPVSAVLQAMPMPVRSVRLGSSSQSIGCVTRSLTAQRRSDVLRASRSTPAVLVMASEKGFKVALLGAAGGIGQPLGLLLKMNKNITQLNLYDLAPFTKGVAKDLSHCNTPALVEGFIGDAELGAALEGCDLVVIPAGVPRKPGMTRDDLFNINAGIVKNLITAVAKHCPNAVINIISNPVNSTVPIAAEVLKAAGVYDPKKVIGVTTLDVVRSNTFVAELKGLDLKDVDVPVIGGHAGTTILPLLSQATPKVTFDEAAAAAMTKRIQEAGTEVVEAKAGAGSATLSMAYAAARMAESCLLGLQGKDNIYECAYVQSSIVPGLDFFASKVKLGPSGVEEFLPLGELSAFEQKSLDEAVTILQGNITKGVEFVNAA